MRTPPPFPDLAPPAQAAAASLLRLARSLAGELSTLRELLGPAPPGATAAELRGWDRLAPPAAPRSPGGAAVLLSLFPYEGPAGEAVRGAKYGGLPFPASAAAELLAEELAGGWRDDLPPRFDPAVVPVPPSPWKYLRRGFHLPGAVAFGLARAAGWPYRPSLLRRSRGGTPQASLSLPGREANVRGLFRPGRRPAGTAPDVLLVDDVATSGATAGACAAALKEGGGRLIVVVTLARAAGPGGESGRGAASPRPGGSGG